MPFACGTPPRAPFPAATHRAEPGIDARLNRQPHDDQRAVLVDNVELFASAIVRAIVSKSAGEVGGSSMSGDAPPQGRQRPSQGDDTP